MPLGMWRMPNVVDGARVSPPPPPRPHLSVSQDDDPVLPSFLVSTVFVAQTVTPHDCEPSVCGTTTGARGWGVCLRAVPAHHSDVRWTARRFYRL